MIKCNRGKVKIKGEQHIILAEVTTALRNVAEYIAECQSKTIEEVIDDVASIAKMSEQDILEEAKETIKQNMHNEEFQSLSSELQKFADKMIAEIEKEMLNNECD